jgi:RNA polymerase sigma factor (sigma-70 family)
MTTAGLSRALDCLRQALADGTQSDAHLLARFAEARDEGAFAALLRRHGPMVLAVCRRLLGHHHDAEDAFQATFLVLARKADSVVKPDALGCWLHQVACRVALAARAANTRRRAREKPMNEIPHPPVEPAEPQDWRPVLDEELNRLPAQYRAAVILCELEGRSRKEVAQLLGVPEGTLSWRLATARKMLAGRLARRGLVLSAAGLWAALAQETASAAVPAALVDSTVRSALLVAAGMEVGAFVPAVALMKGVLRTMFVAKLKLAVAVVMVVTALGAGGFAYQAGQPGAARAQVSSKPLSELEALRKENELLRLNLQVVLEKVRAQEAELRALGARGKAGAKATDKRPDNYPATEALERKRLEERYRALIDKNKAEEDARRLADLEAVRRKAASAGEADPRKRFAELLDSKRAETVDPLKQVEDALKALRGAADQNAGHTANEAMEKALKALKQLREQMKEGSPGTPR